MQFPRHAFQSQTAAPNEGQAMAILEGATAADVCVLDADFIAETYLAGPETCIAARVREANPAAALFAYFSPADFQPYSSELQTRLRLGFDPRWLMRSVVGSKPIVLYTNPQNGAQTQLMNLTVPELRERIVDVIASTPGLSVKAGLRGIYLDWCCPVGWVSSATNPDGTPRAPGGVDLFGHGTATPETVIDAEWREAWNQLADGIRRRTGLAVLGNGGYQAVRGYRVDGLMIEGFLAANAAPAAWGSWSQVMRSSVPYAGLPYSFLMHTTPAATTPAYYQAQRLAVGSALLLGIGVVCNNANPYQDRAWIDEMGVNDFGAASRALRDREWIGRPLGDAYDALAGPSARLADALFNTPLDQIEAKAWRRDFINGAALVNPSSTAKSIPIPAGSGLRFIKGLADPASNPGGPVGASVVVPPRGAVILFRSN